MTTKSLRVETGYERAVYQHQQGAGDYSGTIVFYVEHHGSFVGCPDWILDLQGRETTASFINSVAGRDTVSEVAN
jgi:hypothetical protein